MNLEKLVVAFLREQRIRRNSPATISYYRISLDKFLEFAGELAVEDITLELYKEYTLYLLDDTTIKSTSAHTYLRAVKAFYNWMIGEEYLPDISRKLKLIKQDKELILPLTKQEIEILLGVFDTTELLGLRNKCIVCLMLDSGLRLSEVIKLNFADLSAETNVIIVNGKGRKQRVVPLGRKTKSLLLAYVQVARMGAEPGEPLFIQCREDRRITPNAVHCFFDDLKRETGINRLYPHLLRHTFATLYILDGGNLETLRVILGHSTISITQIYLHLAANYRLAYANHVSHLDMLP